MMSGSGSGNGNSSGAASAVGGDGRHDDDAALTEFLSSLMDYTPTVLLFFEIFSNKVDFEPNKRSSTKSVEYIDGA
jgi:hypothetical protein